MKKMIGIAMMVALAALPALAQEEAAPAAAPAVEPVVAAPAAPTVAPGMKVALPCKVYGNCEDEGEQVFIPSGYMGGVDNGSALEYDDCWKENPHSGESCIKVVYPEKGWAGITWQNPANNWGDDEGGVDLRGAKQVSFWARGDKGGEMVEFGLGGIARNKPFYDTGKATIGKVKLDATWKQFMISLDGKDLTRIVSGFKFVVVGRTEPVTFYIDDIVYE